MPHLRTLSLLFMALAAPAIFAGCATNGAQPQTAAEPIQEEPLTNYQQAQLTVHGLSCPLCASNMDNALKDIFGVATVWTDLEQGLVTVGFIANHTVTRQQLAEAVEGAGFTLKAIEPAGQPS